MCFPSDEHNAWPAHTTLFLRHWPWPGHGGDHWALLSMLPNVILVGIISSVSYKCFWRSCHCFTLHISQAAIDSTVRYIDWLLGLCCVSRLRGPANIFVFVFFVPRLPALFSGAWAPCIHHKAHLNLSHWQETISFSSQLIRIKATWKKRED